ncbi:hypothetical protein D048_1905A, partial [Vibrio parahaemolyticus VPTS-2009]
MSSFPSGSGGTLLFLKRKDTVAKKCCIALFINPPLFFDKWEIRLHFSCKKSIPPPP